MKKVCGFSIALSLVGAFSFAPPAQAGDLAGQKTIVLIGQSGVKYPIGHVKFSPSQKGYAFTVKFDRGAFKELYMEESNFLCLAITAKYVCHFPYPPQYSSDDSGGVIADNDLRPLEYALLFIQKGENAVDVNPFNGRYYQLKIIGSHLEGAIKAADLRPLIGSPNEKYPVGYEDLDPLPPEEQPFPTLVIE